VNEAIRSLIPLGLIFFFAYSAFLAFVVGNAVNRWWEREAIRRGFAEYSGSHHVFLFKTKEQVKREN
jgi:hypothetical protein